MRSDRLDLMLAFVEIARRLSFVNAARELSTTPSSLSRRIARLESELGARLLHRSTRRVELTGAGEVFLDHCVRVMDTVKEAESSVREIRGVPSGTFRLHVPMTFGFMYVAPILPEFLQLYPDLRVDLVMSDEYMDFIKEKIDLAIRIGELHDSRLVAKQIARNERILCAAPSYLERVGVPEHPDGLQHVSCLHPSHYRAGDVWHLYRGETHHQVRVHGQLRANNGEAIRRATVFGCGISLLALFLIGEDLRKGRLVRVLPEWRGKDSGIYALWPAAKTLPGKTRAFVEFLIERLPVSGWS